MIGLDDNQLKVAKALGATRTINSENEHAVDRIMSLTNVDLAMEAVGLPVTFELCRRIVVIGGHIPNIGVHGKSIDLFLEKLLSRNITITTRLLETVTTPMLLKTAESGRRDPKKLITHCFKLDQIMEAYETFENAGKRKH